jgi:ribonucleoside-diphosphate reductase beta chain
MMLSAFSNIETVHITAYSHLLDTVGMPEAEYQAFLRYREMKDKHDYMQGFSVESHQRSTPSPRGCSSSPRSPSC